MGGLSSAQKHVICLDQGSNVLDNHLFSLTSMINLIMVSFNIFNYTKYIAYSKFICLDIAQGQVIHVFLVAKILVCD